jgi:GxxExxY protein
MLHEQLTDRIIASAIAVHRAVGPGLAEHSYHTAMTIEMTDRGMRFQDKPALIVRYKGATIGWHIPDFIVEDLIVVELKAVRSIEPVFVAQALTYLRVTKLEVALVINFNVEALKFGVKRVVKENLRASAPPRPLSES